MAYTLTELRATPATDKRFLVWSGCEGLYFRAGKRGGVWYWRGVINRLKQGKGAPIRIKLAPDRSSDGSLRSEKWLLNEARKFADMCANGQDPHKKPENPKPEEAPKTTTQEVWDDFMKNRRPISNNYRQQQKDAWEWYAKPFLGEVAIEDVDTALIERMFDEVKNRPATSNDLHTTLAYFFKWSKRRYKKVQPDLLNRDRLKESPAQERLKEEEIPKFGAQCLKKKHDKFTKTILFLLLTGCRVSLLKHWQPEWIDGDIMLIPDGIEDLKDACFVLMTPEAKRLLPHLVRPNTRHNVGAAVRRLSRQAKVTKISSHDLRRTFISFGVDLGYHETTMLALTDHKPTSKVARAYIQREALKLMPTAMDVAKRLAELIDLEAILRKHEIFTMDF